MNPSPFWQEESDVLEKEKLVESHVLILFNDDFNTFEHVIQSLIEVCNHTEHQAEQCAWFVHYKGKCEVKNGEFKDLKKKCTELLRRGLSAEVF